MLLLKLVYIIQLMLLASVRCLALPPEPASNARLIRAFSHVCGQVETEVNCSRKEISADVPRQRRRWVQVVEGSNPACPTKPNLLTPQRLRA
jgi:hypothetical protein